MTIDAMTQSAFAGLLGKRCCRQRVGRGRSLSVGFGEKVPHLKTKAVDPFYGEWEIGTYRSAWRIVRDGEVVCGSLDVVDSIDELDGRLQGVPLGAVIAVEAPSKFDLRVRLDGGVFIDFVCASAEDDEMFHVFGPDSLYVEYTCADGWRVGKSSAPWA
jgi:hypothetical protein